jgi:prepilin-type N-terminal cleavage/methylation domain-containing protein
MKEILQGDHSQKGFTMFEIMIALILIALIFVAIPASNRSSDRSKLETAIDDIDRSIRFAQNEAILRNTIVRVKIEMDTDPIKYTVEAGPKGEFVLHKYVDKDKLSIKEKKLVEKKEKKSSARFNAVSEFKDAAREFPEVVKIIGFSSNYTDSFIQSGEIHIYMQPSGRRDEAIIVFSTGEEVASLEIMAFSQETKVNYSQIDMEFSNQSLEDVQQGLAKELYEQWIKD